MGEEQVGGHFVLIYNYFIIYVRTYCELDQQWVQEQGRTKGGKLNLSMGEGQELRQLEEGSCNRSWNYHYRRR